jgi:hypothetical protein
MSDILAAMEAKARASADAASLFPALPMPQTELVSMHQSVRALIEVVEMLIGRRGTDATTAALKARVEAEIRRLEGLIP